MARRSRARVRADRLRLTQRGRARRTAKCVPAALFCASLLAGCSDGRLDVFTPAGGRGGAAGTGLVPAGTGGDQGGAGTAAIGGGAAVAGGAGRVNGPLLLGDFEDGNPAVKPDGWWYATDDGTGPPNAMTFDVGTGHASQIAVHVAAGPTTGFGSFLGLDLPGGKFDLTGFTALSFWARMEPAAELSVRFQTSATKQYVLPADLDGTWREVRLPIADFRSLEGAPLNPSDVTHLQFWLADTRPAYDLYVDDVWLLVDP